MDYDVASVPRDQESAAGLDIFNVGSGFGVLVAGLEFMIPSSLADGFDVLFYSSIHLRYYFDSISRK